MKTLLAAALALGTIATPAHAAETYRLAYRLGTTNGECTLVVANRTSYLNCQTGSSVAPVRESRPRPEDYTDAMKNYVTDGERKAEADRVAKAKSEAEAKSLADAASSPAGRCRVVVASAERDLQKEAASQWEWYAKTIRDCIAADYGDNAHAETVLTLVEAK